MARSVNGRSGFTPENLTAGLDLEINQTNIKDKKLINDEKKNETKDVTAAPKEELQEDRKVVIKEETSPSENSSDLAIILGKKKKNSKNAQVNVYLYDDDLRNELYAMGKFVGKQNGGKSMIVENALKEYFERNREYVDQALKQFPPKK
ncbi:hypothetical protein B835_2033 [Enterococcus mundtii 3F]|uniref:hypothetical protein n=1 Tax=Enterococcus mundtii TaxID=53346 RepID=UPI0023040092|nr:hypothetical protein [Enterococcus mundtii]MDA9462104.1 hypothetical protein [Enterococcus mundtii 3F]